MSIERTANGAWRVRWREGGHNRSKGGFVTKAEAALWEQERKRHKRMGTLARMEMGTDTFEDFVAEEYWPKHMIHNSLGHQENVGCNLDAHIIPRFGGYELRAITRAEVESFLADLKRNGVGGRAQQTCLRDLKAILNKAVDWEKLATNPAALVKMPKHQRKPIVPPTPLEVERVRSSLLAGGRTGDSVLVSVLAYAGLRPQEALALTWPDIRERTLLVGPEHKTGHRSVDLWQPLRSDLAEWKLAMGGKHHLVFPTHSGRPWTRSNWKNWGRRVWKEHKEPHMGPPYHLRHLFCSLMLREDSLSIYEQAAQAGHDVPTHLDQYGHLINELKGKGSAEDAIRAARAKVAETREAM